MNEDNDKDKLQLLLQYPVCCQIKWRSGFPMNEDGQTLQLDHDEMWKTKTKTMNEDIDKDN